MAEAANGIPQPHHLTQSCLWFWGDVPYPEMREYNQFGDRTTLVTYRGGIGWTGSTWPATTGTGDVTTWYYDEATGLLTNKTDAASQHVLFDYYNTHLRKTRVWARGVASTNIYRANGDFVRIDYPDGTSVQFTDDQSPYLDRLAKPAVILDMDLSWRHPFWCTASVQDGYAYRDFDIGCDQNTGRYYEITVVCLPTNSVIPPDGELKAPASGKIFYGPAKHKRL